MSVTTSGLFLSLTNVSFSNIYTANQHNRNESLLQEAENYLAKSENCESHKDFVSALSYCTEAASE